MARFTLAFFLVLFVVVEVRSLRPGGINVLTKYKIYYVPEATNVKTRATRQTCTRTCRVLWIFDCYTKCRTVNYYKWVTRYKLVRKTKPFYECKHGWKANGDQCTTPICTGGCLNNGLCTAPNICRCKAGWSGTRCGSDINECSSHHDCQDKCVNTQGSYRCACSPGHFLASDGKTCTDHDECAGNAHGCDQGCVNFPGGYNCTCSSGYRLNTADFKSCEDIDECRENISGCAQKCKNAIGNFSCSCNSGYYLENDGKSCDDLDECAGNAHGCDQGCVNFPGGYNCTCSSGYRLNTADFKSCKDIDECRENISGCAQKCNNAIGNFSCSCNSGYYLENDGKSCDVIYCPTLNPPVKGFVYTPCETVFGSQCIVGCARGYYLEGTNKVACVGHGVWKPDNLTCRVIKACEPNLCQNGGKCSAISSSRYSCDCSHTGYKGTNCQVGTITPSYPIFFLTLNVPSSLLQFSSSLPSDNVILTPVSRGVIFTPSRLIFNTTSNRQFLTITARQHGIHFIEYLISGPNAVDFEPPRTGVIFVKKTENRKKRTTGVSPQYSKLPTGCHEIEISKCPEGHHAIVASSTSSWDVLGPLKSTSGIVTVQAGKMVLPLSIDGASINTKTLPSVEGHCDVSSANYSIEKLLTSRMLTSSFLNGMKTSFPKWLFVTLPQDVNSKSFSSYDLKTYVMSSSKLRQKDVGEGQPLPDNTPYSLLLTRNINLTVGKRTDILGSPLSIAVDLCSTLPTNVILRPSINDLKVVNNNSVIKRLKENGWSITVTSVQFSKTKSIQKLAKGGYWNGEKFVRIDSTTKGNMALVSSLRKSFTNHDMVNCYLSFDGTMVIGVAKLDDILHSPLDQEWSVDLYGNMKLMMEFKVEGEKTNVTLSAPKSISYAVLGGRFAKSTPSKLENPQGLYISHRLEECPFLHSELNNFIELGSNKTVSVVLDTRLQLKTTPENNRSGNGDMIRIVSMTFNGNLKHGPLRFNDIDIKLWAKNTEWFNASSSVPRNTGIELTGNYRKIYPRRFGIFNSFPSNLRLYISGDRKNSSVGSFESAFKFLGFEKRVNVSFSGDGLTFNVSGKVQGTYDTHITCRSSLASWENQKFVAIGEFLPGSGGLAGALDNALYDYGKRMMTKATRRIALGKERVQKANRRLIDISAFADKKQREMDKAVEDYNTAEERLKAAKIDLKNLEGNVSARLDNLRQLLKKLCTMKQCRNVCREGVVCTKCSYKVVAKSRETCLTNCTKTEKRLVKSDVNSVPCRTKDCTRVYLKSGQRKSNLANVLQSITKGLYSHGKKASDSFSEESFSVPTDFLSTFTPGQSMEDVCPSSQYVSNQCERDRRDGYWDYRVRSTTCTTSNFTVQSYLDTYTCERPCERHVTNEIIPKSCCSPNPCAFSIVNVTCVAENAVCSKIRNDALEKTVVTNTSAEILKKLESARANVSYWKIIKQSAAIRLASATKLLNMTQMSVRSVRKAYNITADNAETISKILARSLKIKTLLNEKRQSVTFVKFDSVKFTVELKTEHQTSLVLPVRVAFRLDGKQTTMATVLDFGSLNASLRSVAKYIFSMYMGELDGYETTNVQRIRSVGDTKPDLSAPTNTSNKTIYQTSSGLQKYHKLCSQFTNYQRALHDIVASLYNLTYEAKELGEAKTINTSEALNSSQILQNVNVDDTVASQFGLETSNTAYSQSFETDPVFLAVQDLQNEAVRDGYGPLHLTSQLLFRNWYSAMEIIFNVVSKHCSGFEDCITYLMDGLTEMYEDTDLSGANKVRRQIVEVESKLFGLIQSVDMSVDDAHNVSSNTLGLLKSITKFNILCARLPNITKQPNVFTEIGVAQTLVLTCNATGDFLVYKWKFNDELLADQTTNALLIRNITRANTGIYTCEVSNHVSVETSTPAFVTVHAPPLITVQPVDRLNVVMFTNDSLRCEAKTSANDISYQWWFKPVNSTTFSALTNETFSHLNFAPMETDNEGWYFCNVSNSYGYSISKTSFVKSLRSTLPVAVAMLSLSVTQKPSGNASFLDRAQPASDHYGRIRSQIVEQIRMVSAGDRNISNASKPVIKNLRIMECKLVKSPEIRTRSIAEVCRWTFYYFGENKTSANEVFQGNAQGVVNTSRALVNAIATLVRAANNGNLSFVLGDQTYIVEKHALVIEDALLVCSRGQNLIKEDLNCVECPPGYYGNDDGNMGSTCLPCSVGSYQPNSGQISCNECPEGFTTVNEGSYEIKRCKVICPAGQYGRIIDNIGQCIQCPGNTYQPSTGQFNCIPCPSGDVTLTKGATHLSNCIPAPTEKPTTEGQITTNKETPVTLEPSGDAGSNIAKLGKSRDGTNHAPLVGGVIGGCILLGLVALLFLLLMRKRRNSKEHYSSDGDAVVVPQCSADLTDCHVNPAFTDDDDFVNKGDYDAATVNPTYEPSWTLTPNEGKRNPLYEGSNFDLQDGRMESEPPANLDDTSSELRKYKSCDNEEPASNFSNPLYESFHGGETKRKDVKLTLTDEPVVDEDA